MPYKRVKAGDRVGEWVLEEKAGEGPHGEVWRARHHVLGFPAAVKVAFAEPGAEALRRCGIAEHALGHDRVARVLGLDLDCDPPYLATQWVDGSCLRRLLDEKGPLPWDKTIEVFRDALAALKAAHDRGEAHGDFRPSNVLVEPSGRAVVRDFGGSDPARRAGDDLLSGVFQDRKESGPDAGPYRPPEASSGSPPDPRGDVWAAGIVFFEALTGRLPQGGEMPSDFAKGLPELADQVFRGSYARPERRYADAGAMAEALFSAPEPDELVADVVDEEDGRGAATAPEPERAPAPPVAAPVEAAPCSCGYRNRPGYRFCVACGKTLPVPPPAASAPGPCRRCGKPRQPGFKFCTSCGARVGEA